MVFVVLDQARAPGFDEDIERCERILLGLGHPDLLQRSLGFRLLTLRQLVAHLTVLCTQQRWPRVLGHTSSIAYQNPSVPSATALNSRYLLGSSLSVDAHLGKKYRGLG